MLDDKMTSGGELQSAATVLETLRHRIASVGFPLDVAGAAQARDSQREILEQIDDHILPRLRRLDAPLLVVVGGSTGAGKSTLVNSLARQEVTSAGVRRPTTHTPVLVCHPHDRVYFVGEHAKVGVSEEPESVPVESEALPEGIALLDTPDIDSIVDSNRDLATRLIAAADLWLYVTTAARYADAVPWAQLRSARERGTVLAIVLNRVPRTGGRDVREHLGELLAERGFGEAEFFSVPETAVDEGMLPAQAVKRLRKWLARLAGENRETVVERALQALLEGFRRRVPELAKDVERQIAGAAELRDEVDASYAAALASVDETMRDGSLLRGELLIRWRDFVGTGELFRSLQSQAGWVRSRRRREPKRMRPGGDELEEALADAVAAAIISGAHDAAERSATRWRSHPAGRALLAEGGDELLEESATLSQRARAAADNWQVHVQELLRSEGATKRSVTRIVSVELEALALVLMVGLLGYAADDSTADSVMVPRRLLRAIFGADSLRTIADKARADLRERAGAVFDAEAERFLAMVDAADVPDDTAVTQLYEATYSLEVTQ